MELGGTEPEEAGVGGPSARGTTERAVLFGRAIVVAAVVMTVTGLVLVERLTGTYEDGLEVTQESAVLVSAAVDPMSTLASDLGLLATELARGVEVTRDVVGATGDGLDQLGAASSTNLSETATGAARISDRLASFIETIERFIPGDADSLAEDLRTFADGLEPIAEQLADIGAQLTVTAAELEAADPTLTALAQRIDAVVADIDALGPTFRALGVTADDVRERADDATTRLGLDRWLLRLLVVVFGLVLGLLGVVVERFSGRLSVLERQSAAPVPTTVG